MPVVVALPGAQLVVGASGTLQEKDIVTLHAVHHRTVVEELAVDLVFRADDVAHAEPAGMADGGVGGPPAVGIDLSGKQEADELGEAEAFAVAVAVGLAGVHDVQPPAAAVPAPFIVPFPRKISSVSSPTIPAFLTARNTCSK